MEAPIVIVLIALAIASFTDVYRGKIYNALVLPMVLIGLIYNAVEVDWKVGVLGAAGAFVIHFAAFALGIQRAGDAKLLIGVGALLGFSSMFEATLWYLVVYFPSIIIVLLYRGRLKQTFTHAAHITTALFLRWKHTDSKVEIPEAKEWIRTAPIISLATVLAMFTSWLEFI